MFSSKFLSLQQYVHHHVLTEIAHFQMFVIVVLVGKVVYVVLVSILSIKINIIENEVSFSFISYLFTGVYA